MTFRNKRVAKSLPFIIVHEPANKKEPNMALTINKPAMREMAATILSGAAQLLMLAILSAGIAFTLLNFMLGCETWDQTLWTERNSCVTLGMIFDRIFE